jgi:hypothetical protein
MNKWLEILIGMFFVIVSIYLVGINYFNLKDAAIILLKGCIIWGAFLIGLVLIFIGIIDLKE